MSRRVILSLRLAPALAAAALAGCSAPGVKPQRPAWRAQAENACVASRRVSPSDYVQMASELEGPGICGLTKPFKVAALQGGAVSFNSTATLDCNMVAELDDWLAEAVQPAALARFGAKVAQINSMGSYACRGMNNQSGAALSEHSFGNALDIGGFVLEDGRAITLVQDWWRGDEQTKSFLLDAHAGACRHFSTVLSPGSNAFHYNHIHVDLALHGRSGRRVCKPAPQERAPVSPILAGAEDTDNDTTGKPPAAAFESAGARDGLGPLAAPPAPPRREEFGAPPEDATSSIVRRGARAGRRG